MKLVVVLRGSAALVAVSGSAPRAATARYEVHVAESLLPSERYPTRADVTGVVIAASECERDDLVTETFEMCGGEQTIAAAYRVDERIQWEHERTWTGTREPGLKQISFLARAEGLSRQQFAEHWLRTHAPLAARHHPTIRRYVQNVVVEPLIAGKTELDGVAELSYRSYEDWRDRKFDSLEGAEIIAADVPRFIDTGSAWHVLGREHVVAADRSLA